MEKKADTTAIDNEKKALKKVMRKGGIVVFMFFLLKGIGWLVLLGLVFFGLISDETLQKIKEAIPLF